MNVEMSKCKGEQRCQNEKGAFKIVVEAYVVGAFELVVEAFVVVVVVDIEHIGITYSTKERTY